MPKSQKTDIELVAEADAAIAAAHLAANTAQLAGNAARLPSAEAAVAFLESPEITALLVAARELIETSADDFPRHLGRPGPEGTKQSLDRVVRAIESSLGLAVVRVASLKPKPAEPPEPNLAQDTQA